jgi:hypothetical protein
LGCLSLALILDRQKRNKQPNRHNSASLMMNYVQTPRLRANMKFLDQMSNV